MRRPQNKYIKQQDQAVKIIQNAISEGGNGGGFLIMDAGKVSELPEDVAGKHYLASLKPDTRKVDEWNNMIPSINAAAQ